MYKFEDLFCLDKKGNIRVFSLRVETQKKEENELDDLLGNSNSEIPMIISETGLLNGKKTAKGKSVTKGKNIGKSNQTTPYEQAVSEASSMFNDKIDEGYKSDTMCKSYLQHSFRECVHRGLITSNTNGNWDEKPMLAEPFDKVKTLPSWFYLQPKLNGVRCMAKFKGGQVLLMSRGGKYYDIPHLEEELKKVFEATPYVILDGEIFNKDYSLQEISGAAREEAGEKDKSFLQYHIYDIANSEKQSDRFIRLSNLFRVFDFNNVFNVRTIRIYEDIKNTVKKLHDEFVSEGYEGAIIRNPNEPYYFGFRDKALIKVKEFIDEEFIIIGCKISQGQSIGDSFVFELQNNINGLTFFARPKGTREQKEEWYVNINQIKGKKATVRYQERTQDNLPHQAHVLIIRDYE